MPNQSDNVILNDEHILAIKAKRVSLVDSAGNPIDGISIGPTETSQYKAQDVDEVSSTLCYVGKQKNDGKYLILEITLTGTVTAIRYANNSNNAEADYTAAFANRAGLTYDLLENLTGL